MGTWSAVARAIFFEIALFFFFFALNGGIKEHKLNTGKEIVSQRVGMVATQCFLLNTNVLPVGLLFLFSDVPFVRIIHFLDERHNREVGEVPGKK